MKKLFFIVSLLLTFSCGAANSPFDRMVIFGDSLSDNGNLYRYMWHYIPASPPYYEGHFSNGPVWVEYLYQSYFGESKPEGFLDYAVGGAGAILSYKENLPFTLTVEVNDYLYWHTDNQKETTLFTIWIGANNYLNGPENVDALTTSVVDAIGGVIERLISYKGNKFLIANLPDLGQLPQARENNNQELLSKLTLAHNEKLAIKFDELRQKYPEVIFVYFDAYAFLNYSMEHASDYGFTNVNDACFGGGFSGWLPLLIHDEHHLLNYYQLQTPLFNEARWKMIKNNPQLLEASQMAYLYQLLGQDLPDEPLNCEGYLFWDHVHPTTFAHSLISQHVRKALDDAGIVVFSGELFE